MEMTGEQRLPAPREAVWAALNDPEVLKQCIPGCDEIQKLSDTEMTAKVSVKVGPVSAKFTGNVTLSELDPPNGYTISGEGKGGVAGFGKGGAKVRLLPDGDGTLLTYEVSASVGGKLAQIGARLIDATAKKMAEQFFEKFTEVVAARGAPATEVAAEGSPGAAAMPARSVDDLPPRQGLSTMTWVSLTTVIVLVILAFVMR
jgi:carbon monoxide dehydrogenase subunit G